jgi:AraC-like DNA-binding protein
MFVARGYKSIRSASLRWGIVFARGVWFKLIESSGIALDTRFVPPAPGPPKPHVAFQLVLCGSYTTYGAQGERIPGPALILMSEEQMEGAERRRPYAFRNEGSPFVGMEIHLAAADLRRPSPLPTRVDLGEAGWEAASRAIVMSQNDDDTIREGLGALLTHLSAREILQEDVVARALRPPPRVIARLWSAVKPLVESYAVSATLDDLRRLSGLSASQVERDMQRLLSTFGGLVGPGIRSLTRHVRLKSAVIFLTVEGVSISEVAELVGYGSADAMGRAFRDAGLAAPSVVQKELLENAWP